MTTEPEDILKNAKLAMLEDPICEEDLGNLSLSLDDSSDNDRFDLSVMGRAYQQQSSEAGQSSGSTIRNAVEDVIESARNFIESDAFSNIKKDRVTVNGEREKLSIYCSNLKRRSSEDQASAKGQVCSMDLVLMASKDYPLSGLFEHVIRKVVQARRNTNSSLYGVGPPIHVCIAWLCHAAQCSISSVVPGGEVFPQAECYIQNRLEQTSLPEIDRDSRTELALCRVLDVFSVCDLRSQAPVDRSILIFAICRLLLDKNTCCAIQYRASLAIDNILNASSVTKRITLVELSSIFPLISDDLVNLQLCHEIIRLSNIGPECCLSLFSSTLIHISERAECAPSNVDKMSVEEFVNANLGIVIDVLDDVLEILENNNKSKCMIIMMFDSSLHPSLCGLMSESTRQDLVNILQRLKHDLGVCQHPDDALVYRLLRNLIDRYEIQSLTVTGPIVGPTAAYRKGSSSFTFVSVSTAYSIEALKIQLHVLVTEFLEAYTLFFEETENFNNYSSRCANCTPTFLASPRSVVPCEDATVIAFPENRLLPETSECPYAASEQLSDLQNSHCNTQQSSVHVHEKMIEQPRVQLSVPNTLAVGCSTEHTLNMSDFSTTSCSDDVFLSDISSSLYTDVCICEIPPSSHDVQAHCCRRSDHHVDLDDIEVAFDCDISVLDSYLHSPPPSSSPNLSFAQLCSSSSTHLSFDQSPLLDRNSTENFFPDLSDNNVLVAYHIPERRNTTGSVQPTFHYSPYSNSTMSSNILNDYREKRDKNNLSSQRSRQKRAEKQRELRCLKDVLERRNIELKTLLGTLQIQVEDYKHILLSIMSKSKSRT
ncbi:basic region leucine zipper [Dictyocaulus viviparus]|uniref:Basic region leucine zipper n=1 Tax=Dictyocaulus viviparus TaxID=29172 RepID=A0A0D8XRM8_DICVI|nr:basic region leucine zipper [Dictyocaulus viviparus]